MPKRIAPLTDTRVRTAKPTKKAQKIVDTQETETFEVIAREWHAKFAPSWAASHATKIIRRFELYVFPWIGSKSIKSIFAQEL